MALALNFFDSFQIEVSDHAIPKHVSPPVPAPRITSLRPASRMKSEASSSSMENYEPTGPPDRTYKVVFAGDAAVGKTSFINRLTKGIGLKLMLSVFKSIVY